MSRGSFGLTSIACVMMRGGTSRGAFFLAEHLPREGTLRDLVLLAAMGSPHPLQVDGIGGGHSLTSKVAIIGRPSRPDADLDYLFAQVSVEDALVDYRANCGNLLAAAGPFALETGLVAGTDPETRLRIHNVNTRMVSEARIPTPNGLVTYAGETRLAGAPGAGAPIRLGFQEAAGALTGALLPTGAPSDVLDGVAVTLIDYAIPVMILAARDLGLTGSETAEEFAGRTEARARIETLRLEAGRRMGLGDVRRSVTPKVALVSPPGQGGTIRSLYLTPWGVHKSHAVTGGLAVAVAATLDGTVAAHVIGGPASQDGAVRLEHAAGTMSIGLAPAPGGAPAASILRTARKLFEGRVLIPANVWDGAAGRAAAESSRAAA